MGQPTYEVALLHFCLDFLLWAKTYNYTIYFNEPLMKKKYSNYACVREGAPLSLCKSNLNQLNYCTR